MRLSESSMDKLYDLMTTGFKYQIVSCKSAEELLVVNPLASSPGRGRDMVLARPSTLRIFDQPST